LTSEKKNAADSAAKLKTTIGLAAKAGKVVAGTPLICESLRAKGSRKPIVVLLGNDCSENTLKKLTDKCAFYEVQRVMLPISMSELSDAVGKRSVVAAVAITDEGLARAVLSKLEDNPSQA